MQFVLAGFSEETGFRVFAFEGIDADRTRSAFSVRTNLALTRRYGIRLQELPLLCQGLLERRDQSDDARAYTFTEAEMMLHAKSCAVEREARLQSKAAQKVVSKQVGTAWRSPAQQ
ncbi:MAG: hypothetical protein H7039_00635 [Bryobacteraceae bacterium]|nr:hypothetical protein [Bryobacteraceae bacterium]